MIDLLSDFRQDVRKFVSHALPVDIAAKVARGHALCKDDYVRWQKLLNEKRWLVGGWPTEWGGGGWGPAKQLVFLQETCLAGAPAVIPYGVNMVGPVLQTYGTDQQRQRHIPGILSSDVWWCQGYSEPGAGSDLASLKTTAIRDGNFYRVNGSKMWTTHAHWADWMHCLVRTSNSSKRQDGITFLMIDMRTSGISVRPILTLDGQHHTNQTFFDNVMVPLDNRVGPEGKGWDIAKFLLRNERLSIADTGPKLKFFEVIKSMNAEFQANSRIPPLVRARFTSKMIDIEARLNSLIAMEAYLLRSRENGRGIAADGSMLKIRGTEVLQSLSEIAIDLQGAYAGVHDPANLHESPDVPDTPTRRASAMAHEYLYSRCYSIFGGTNEIQRNIIAKQTLRGL